MKHTTTTNSAARDAGRNFTWADKSEGAYGSLFADRSELIYAPLSWQTMGLQQTASGYGRKLTNPFKIRFEGRVYRLYTTIFSNAGSTWFKVKGQTVYVN